MRAPGFFRLVLVIEDVADEFLEFAQPCQRRQVRVKQHSQDLAYVVHTPR